MKLVQTTKALTVFTFMILLALTSCRKEEEIIETLSDEEAVELIENSMQKSTTGMTTEVEELSQKTTEEFSLELECGVVYQEDFERSYDGPVVSASYDVNWGYEMACNMFNIPTSLSFTSSSSGNYLTQRISSVDTSWGTMAVEGLQPTGDSLVFSGSYGRAGTQVLTIRNSRNVSSTVEITLADLIVEKETYQILSGTATVVLTGTITNGESFSFTGTLIFLGDRTATLTLNGETYAIDLN